MHKQLFLAIFFLPLNLISMERQRDPYFDGENHLGIEEYDHDDYETLKHFLKQCGSLALAQRDTRLYKQLIGVAYEYRKKGFDIPNLNFRSSHYSPEDEAKIEGTAFVDTTANRIHTIGNFEKWYTPGETSFVLAHEVGHIVVDQNNWLRPHWYMYHLAHPVTALAAANSLLIATAFLPAKMKKTIFCTTFLSGGYLVALPKVVSSLRGISDENGKVVGYKFQCLQKLVEFECDVLAAYVLPEGAKHGASYFQKAIIREGGNNKKDTDHPKLSTRLKYMKAIQWLQEHRVRKHT